MDEPRDRRRQQNRWGEGELLRTEIIAAGRRLLERVGTESGVTLRGVAREASVTAPSIYAHFSDREELIDAILVDIAADGRRALDEALAALEDDASPRARLEAYCEVYISIAHERPASYRVLYVRPDPSAMPTVRRTMMQIHEAFKVLLADAAPQFSAEEVRVRGVLAWAALHGLAELPPHHPRFPWPEQSTLVRQLLDLHLTPSNESTAYDVA